MLSLERRYKWNLPISAVYGCRIKFRYFPLSSLREVDIRCYMVAGAPGHRRTTCQFHVCVAHRSTTHKFVTPTALSRIDNSWRSTTLRPAKKLTSSTANLGWCHVHFIRDSYSTFIHQVIGPSKNSMESFFNAKFDFKSTWNRDSTTSHHKHPVCQSPAGEAEKLTNVWSRYFGTNLIIDNWHRCLGLMWRKRKHYFEKLFKKIYGLSIFISLTHKVIYILWGLFLVT